jgi:TetR/AcrR family transcriptional regulator, regulator of autoinduction and epiphytic fitness
MGTYRTLPFYNLSGTVPFYKFAVSGYLHCMDPRIRRTRGTVLPAALGLLADRGFADFTMEGVAEASGVSKSTVYRHWPTKLTLLRDALEELNRQPDVQLEGGPARVQVEQLLEHLVAALSDSVLAACIPALIEAAEHHREVAEVLHRYSARRRSTLTAVLRKGIGDGEFPRHLDPELAALALSGPIFYRRLMTADPLPANEIPRLVQQVLGPVYAKVDHEIIRTALEWDRAMVTNDPDEIGVYMADEWMIIGPDGSIGSKTAFLELIRSGELTHDIMESHDMKVRVYGDAVVVTGRGVSGGHYRGEPFHLVERVSCVFVRKQHLWKCVLTHLSLISGSQ